MDRRERICRLIPLVAHIEDQDLRSGVVDLWVKAWDESEWEDAADCPFHVEIRNCSLIQHTNAVATIALAIASCARETWQTEVDTDLLLAGAILHDVCKLVEHAPQAGKPGKTSALGESLVHGAYGVHLALNAGLPLSLVDIIGAHTPQVSKVPRVLEGAIVRDADHAAARTCTWGIMNL